MFIVQSKTGVHGISPRAPGLCRRGLGFFLLFILLTACNQQTQPQKNSPEPLFSVVEQNNAVPPPRLRKLPIQAFGLLQVNVPRLAAVEKDGLYSISLWSGHKHSLHVSEVIHHRNGDMSIHGHLDEFGRSYDASFTLGPTGLLGRVQTPSALFTITQDGRHSWIVNHSAAGMHHPQARADTFSGVPSLQPRVVPPISIQSNHTTIIDLLVLYSPGFAAAYPDSAAQSRINELIAIGNRAYNNSQVRIQIRAVQTLQVNYSDSKPNDQALQDMRNGVAPFNSLNDWMNQSGADLVVFLRPFSAASSGSCGVAIINGAQGAALSSQNVLSVVSEGIDGVNYCDDHTLVHEIGHSLGSTHNHENASVAGHFAYSYGYGVAGVFGSVMSYLTPQSGRFSNPLIHSCQGLPCGVDNVADNVRSMNLTRDIVAGFRPSLQTTAIPTLTNISSNNVGEISAQLSITVDPGGEDTLVDFSYGLASITENTSAQQIVPGNTVDFTVRQTITGLICDSTYTFQANASNGSGAVSSGTASFLTLPCSSGTPILTTRVDGEPTADGVALSALADWSGGTLRMHFEYGVDTSYGQQSPVQTISKGNNGLFTLFASVNGLNCETLYHVRVVGNASGNDYFGQDEMFTTGSCALASPLVVTNAATEVLQTSVTLNGTVNPQGNTGTAYFHYGITPGQLANSSDISSIGSTSGSVPVSAIITGLSCDTSYYYQFVFDDGSNVYQGQVASLLTLPCSTAPGVTTPAISNPTQTQVEVGVSFETADIDADLFFEYGLQARFDQRTTSVIVNSATANSHAEAISGLQCNSVYSLRAVISNANGQTSSPPASFTTDVCGTQAPPQLGTVTVSTAGANSATIRVQVNPNLDQTSVFLNFGTDTNYGSRSDVQNVAAVNRIQSVEINLSGLACATSYHFQALAQNSGGIVQSNDNSFSTLSCSSQADFDTDLASNITQTSATLGAWVNFLPTPAQLYFQYGRTLDYGLETDRQNLGPVNQPQTISSDISALVCGTLYHYRLVVDDNGSLQYGNDRFFKTPNCATGGNTVLLVTADPLMVESNSATLAAQLDLDNLQTILWFEYGLNQTDLTSTPKYSVAGQDSNKIASWRVLNLSCETSYVYRAIIQRDDGSAEGVVQYGDFQRFTTLPCPLGLQDLKVELITDTSVIIQVRLDNYDDQTTVRAMYGLDSNLINSTQTTPAPAGWAQLNFINLQCATRYQYKVLINGSANTALETDIKNFTTRACTLPPGAQTLDVAEIGSFHAVLRGLVTPNSEAASWHFNYGVNKVITERTEQESLNKSFREHLVEIRVDNLVCNTEYFYKLYASNGLGDAAGDMLSFTTGLCAVDLPVARGDSLLAVRKNHNLVVQANGALLLWGQNASGQLATDEDRQVFVYDAADAQGHTIVGVRQVATGSEHSLALLEDGSVLAWGNNDKGQLGDGSTVSRAQALAVIDSRGVPLQSIVAISSGTYHNIALGVKGELYAWGDNASGQLGNGGSSVQPSAQKLESVLPFIDIGTGDEYSIALSADKRVWTWGSNSSFQLGLGDNQDRNIPTLVDGVTQVERLFPGHHHVIVMDYQQNLWGWGDNTYKQLHSRLPEQVKAPGRLQHFFNAAIAEISAGGQHNLVLLDTGTVLAWGNNNYGQAGVGSQQVVEQALRVKLASSGEDLEDVVDVFAAEHHSIAVTAGGTVFAWGRNDFNQLGNSEVIKSDMAIAVLDEQGSPASVRRQRLLISVEEIQLREGESFSFTVRMTGPPIDEQTKIVLSNRTFNRLEFLRGESLVFTRDNWDEEQTVTIRLREDENKKSEALELLITGNGLNSRTIPVQALEKSSRAPAPVSALDWQGLLILLLLLQYRAIRRVRGKY